MQGPLVFIATNRLKPGRLDSERARVPGLVEFVEANEPRQAQPEADLRRDPPGSPAPDLEPEAGDGH